MCSVFAIADSRTLLTSRAMLLRDNLRSASAVETFLPRIRPATRLSFCGLTRSMRATALASFSGSVRSWAFLLMGSASRCRRRRGGCGRGGWRARTGAAFRLAVRRMAVEHARRRELAELVADHLLGDQHGNVLLPVVDAERQPDEVRQDGRAAAPDPDHLVPAGGARRFCLLEPIAVNEWALPD